MSNHRDAKRRWIDLGGQVLLVRRTGEVRYVHPVYPAPIRANARRLDAPAILLSRIGQLLRLSGDV